jgi:hypothetical protein
MLSRLVTAVSAAIESYLSRSIAQASYIETRHGNGRCAMMLEVFPVTAVASVTVNGIAIPARTTPLGTGYTFDDAFIYLSGYEFCRGRQNVGLQYTAGFLVTPWDLEQAAIDIVGLKYRGKDRIGEGGRTFALGTVSYLRDVPPDVMRMLDQYKRVLSP